jgi:hypothetical protein
MNVLYPVCCGLDVQKASVTACRRSPGDGDRRRKEIRTFGTTTRELLWLVDWLTAAGCTHVAMESTGIYWRPGLQPPRGQRRALPGQCPAREDGAEAQEQTCGTASGSPSCSISACSAAASCPLAAQREMGDVVRYRKRLIEDRAGSEPGGEGP